MSDEGQRERRLTVAQVRVGRQHAEVAFYESARMYRLLRSHPAYEDLLHRLRTAGDAKVRVEFSEPNSDVIANVSGAS